MGGGAASRGEPGLGVGGGDVLRWVLVETCMKLGEDPTQYVPATDSEAELIVDGDPEMEVAIASPTNGAPKKRSFFGLGKKLRVFGSWRAHPETSPVPRAELRGTEEEPILEGSILGG